MATKKTAFKEWKKNELKKDGAQTIKNDHGSL